MVRDPLEYKYSSYRNYMDYERNRLLVNTEEIETNRVLNMFKNQGKEGYRMFVEGKISHEEQELLIMKDIGENELWLPW